MGYELCGNGTFMPNFEKIAIYVDNNGKPQHAARQLQNGLWTSKIGVDVDIEHELHGLENSRYGNVRSILKRPLAS